MKTLFFKECGISYGRGSVTINTSEYNFFDKHYDVVITIDDELSKINIAGTKCVIEMNWMDGQLGKEELFMESAFKDHKTWFGLGPVERVLREGWIEKKQGESVSYQSNNYVIKM
jgi:hypothetical protein